MNFHTEATNINTAQFQKKTFLYMCVYMYMVFSNESSKIWTQTLQRKI